MPEISVLKRESLYHVIGEIQKAHRAGQGGANMAYAVSYAKAALQMTDEQEIKVQCLYILNNLSGWRGDTAKFVKGILKDLSK